MRTRSLLLLATAALVAVAGVALVVGRGGGGAGPMLAQVLTDTECAPDERMISHCRNELHLADGRTMVIRHPHDMRSVPCLAPGEQVLLVPASA